MLEVGGVDGSVEADVFDCGSDDGASGGWAGGARDYINVGCADDEVEREGGRESDGEHLAFSRYDLEVRKRRDGGGPGSRAIYEV